MVPVWNPLDSGKPNGWQHNLRHVLNPSWASVFSERYTQLVPFHVSTGLGSNAGSRSSASCAVGTQRVLREIFLFAIVLSCQPHSARAKNEELNLDINPTLLFHPDLVQCCLPNN